MPKLGRLESVELRKAWKHEATEFTPWLANKENIALLGEVIGLELDVQSVETAVGPFSADILCKDMARDQYVLIENQIERTDHKHLGQLLTYAAGLHAVTIVWIAARFTEEHRAALDWLNDITGEDFSFFGLEIELWRIGDSDMAPKFNIISKPNDWSKSVREFTEDGKLSEIQQMQLEFWTRFKRYMEENSKLKTVRPRGQPLMPFNIGRTDFWISAIFSTWDQEADNPQGVIRVELRISHKEHASEYFQLLERVRTEIEAEFGGPLIWHNPPEMNSCRVYVRKPVDVFDRKQWDDYCFWLKDNIERIRQVFAERIRKLDLGDIDMESGEDAG